MVVSGSFHYVFFNLIAQDFSLFVCYLKIFVCLLLFVVFDDFVFNFEVFLLLFRFGSLVLASWSLMRV